MLQPEHIESFLWLLLLIPIAVAIFWSIRWKKKVLANLGEHALVKQLVATYSSRKFLQKGLLVLASVTLLVFALVNFRKPDSSEKVKLNGTDLMIALDVSNSMMAKDIQPNRLEKAKLVISKLIDQLEGNRLGLVVFAGNAYLQMPLTTDAAAAKLFLSTINPGLVPLQGTNISEALQMCNKSLNTEDKKYKSILLISDGEDHDDAALATAKELKGKGVVINTIGVGSPQGAPIVDPETNEPKRDDQGNIIVSKLNQEELKNIAAQSNGVYELLDGADDAAQNIITQLRGMDKKPITDTTLTNYSSYFWVFVGLAFMLLALELLMGDKRKLTTIRTRVPIIKEEKDMKTNTKVLATVSVLVLLLASFSSKGQNQKENDNIRKGNEAYKQQKFEEAGKEYEMALKQNSNNPTATFNLGNTQFKNGKFEEAAKQYDALAANKDNSSKQLQAQSLYNKGVSLVKQKKLEEAIDAFKQSLRANPTDEETRENLQKALNEKKQQDQQKQDDKKDDKKKDKKDQQKDEDKKKEDQKKDEKKEQQKDQEQQKEKEQPQPKISKKEAEQKLEALRQEEKKVQQKISQKQRSTIKQPEKDW